ncbi:MAG: hypothetical protein ACRD96_14605, partial [Bryobacteraceae bacterium]
VVQTESTALGQVLRQKVIDTLPLKGHSSLFMFTLATGVVNNRYGEDTRPNDTITNVLFSANGSPVASGDVSVDGVANTVNVNRGVNISQWVPATDAIAEFKLVMGTLPAEYGRTGGSFMNIVIKSGTNELHGSLYEYFRNNVLDANQFFPRGQGRQLAGYGSNTYGVSAGGPIWRNRTFFFVNYEGSKEGNAWSQTSAVPTARMRAGDFTEFSGVVYNPLSVRTVDGVPMRDPFPGKIIPQSMQDPVGRNLLRFYPEPTNAGPIAATPWVQNFNASGKWPRDYSAYTVKVDHHIGSRHQMFARMNYGTSHLIFPPQFDGIATPGSNNVNRPHFGIALNDTFLINPSTTFDVRLGYARGKEKRRPWSD